MINDSRILITNDEELIEKYRDIIDIEYSIFVGKTYFPHCSSIIIDYDTYVLEDKPIDAILPYKDRVFFVGDGMLEEITSISKSEFHPDLIVDMESWDIQHEEDHVVEGTAESLQMDEIISIYTKEDASVAEIEKTLLGASKSLRIRFYDLIPYIREDNLLKQLPFLNFIRREYLVHTIKKQIKKD